VPLKISSVDFAAACVDAIDDAAFDFLQTGDELGIRLNHDHDVPPDGWSGALSRQPQGIGPGELYRLGEGYTP
jgi:hypothetical protein